VRVNLKGIHRITRTLATGERVTYFYAWRGGPRLVGEPGSPEFIRSYDAAQSNRRSPDPSLFRSTIAAYKASRAFTGLRERTRADYSKQIAKIEAAFGDPASRRLGRSARVTRDLLNGDGAVRIP
jgi:hypothetical protein